MTPRRGMRLPIGASAAFRRRCQIGGLIVICALTAALVTACFVSRVNWARNHVAFGDSRETAISALGGEAWYHAECWNDDRVTDLFFYGDHRFDKAEIVIVLSFCDGRGCRVENLGGFEPYMWHAAYADCYDRGRFSD